MNELANPARENPGVGHFREVLSRFYLPLAITAGAPPLIVFGVAGGYLEMETVVKIGFTVALGFFLTFGCRLHADVRGWRTPRYLALSAAAIALLAGLVFASDPEIMTFTTVGLAVLLLLFAAPFIGRDHGDGELWAHVFALLRSIVLSFGMTLILGLGLVAMLFAAAMLQPKNVPFGELLVFLFAWLLGCLYLPFQFLLGLPRKESSTTTTTMTECLTMFVNRAIAPVITAFIAFIPVLLFAMLIQWSIPAEDFALPACILGVTGIAAWFVSHPLGESANALTRLFRKHIHMALVPLALMAIAATWSGIAEGGVTEKRYMLMLLALWIGGVATYHILPTRRRLIVAPLSLAALLATSAFGPWGAAEVSTRGQLVQLEKILSENGMLVAGKIVPASDYIDAATMKKFSGVTDYFHDHNRQGELWEWLTEHGLPREAMSREGLLNAMNIRYISRYSEFPEFDFQSSSRSAWKAGNTQHLIQIEDDSGHKWFRPEVEPNAIVEFGGQDGAPKAVFDREAKTITVVGNDGNSVRFDVSPVIRGLRTSEPNNSAFETEPITLEAESPSGRLHAFLFLDRLEGEIWQEVIRLEHISALVLVTSKAPPQ